MLGHARIYSHGFRVEGRLDGCTHFSTLPEARQGFIKLTIENVLESVVFSVLLDLIPETLAKLTAHEWVLLFALL